MSTVVFWVPCSYFGPPHRSLNMISSIVFGQPVQPHELSAFYWCFGHFGAQLFGWLVHPPPPQKFSLCLTNLKMIFSMHVTTAHPSSVFCFTLLCYIHVICFQAADRDGTDEPRIRLYWIIKLRRCERASHLKLVPPVRRPYAVF
jgi:hypothetical protein